MQQGNLSIGSSTVNLNIIEVAVRNILVVVSWLVNIVAIPNINTLLAFGRKKALPRIREGPAKHHKALPGT